MAIRTHHQDDGGVFGASWFIASRGLVQVADGMGFPDVFASAARLLNASPSREDKSSVLDSVRGANFDEGFGGLLR